MTIITRRHLLAAALTSGPLMATGAAIAAPRHRHVRHAPYNGATPSPRQLAWHKRQAYAFVHFTVNTFTDREWGYGDEPVSVFNPSDFSADQIVGAVKAGGLKAAILTAKHHDGFCLWPSRYTEHSIKNSPYKNGHGDIVREMSEACQHHGLGFGLYLSPWDRNHAEYGRPAYVEYYHNQLQELTTQYGKLVEVWFDGANGGDGYYGGARERRKIDGHTFYQWDTVRDIVRRNQPGAVMFADSDMDVRWVGNEEGVAGDPCWPTWDYTTPYSLQKANSGVRGGPIWNPAEVDVSIRPGWFWHADEAPRTPANLMRLWFDSVGRGANLLLNIAPDRRGRVPDADVAALTAWKDLRDRCFAHNLASGAKITADDGKWQVYSLAAPATFDLIRVAEDLQHGVRVGEFAFDIWTDGKWTEIAHHACIGNERLIRLDAPVTTQKVRLRILSATAAPILRDFGLFRMPDIVEEPAIRRDGQGLVTLTAAVAGLEVHYTVDGNAPTSASPLYAAPFALPDGGTVRAIARQPTTGVVSAIVSRDFDISSADWQIVSGAGDQKRFDGTFVGQSGQPVDIVIDLAKTRTLKGFTLTPAAQDISLGVDKVAQMGPPAGYEVWVGQDGQTWTTSAASGEFANIAASRGAQTVRFATPQSGRYLRLRLARAVQDKPIIVFGAIGVITR